ncbi:LysE family translocator [Streptomyces sp. ODS28]|uniref:LysE family translocator n=1 Tax=Streptomyces sp. ODS28 TaxID=3136688 RepID=UPI0031E96FB8
MQHLPAFFAASAASLVIPGPDFVLVTRHSLTRGSGPALATAAGVVGGLTVHAGLAVAGVAALLAALPEALTVLRLAGAAYLITLGVLALRSRGGKGLVTTDPEEAQEQPAQRGLRGPFVQGLLNNLLNPKAVVFFVALLPTFVSPGGSAAGQTALLAATVIAMAALWWSLYIALLGRLGRSWKALRSPRADRVVTKGSGAALIAVGAGISVSA